MSGAQLMELIAILISPQGVTGTLRDLIERLGGVGVQVLIVDELAAAVEASARYPRPPAILLDLREVGAGEVEDQQAADLAQIEIGRAHV